MPVLGELGVIGKPTETPSGETVDPSLVPKDFQSGGGSGGGGGSDDEEGGDNTNMLLILGAVAVGGFLLLNK
jgi:hypothetical protein